MKILAATILCAVSFSAFGQEMILAHASEGEPIQLFQLANESLDQGNTRKAIFFFERVVRLYELQGRQSELAESYLGMALSFALNGNYSESIRYHKKALRAHKKYKSGKPYEILFNLGLAYRLAGNERKASYYLKSGNGS